MTRPDDELHLPEGSYAAYIEGVAPPDVVDHIETCAQCQDEVAGLKEMEELFREAFKNPPQTS